MQLGTLGNNPGNLFRDVCKNFGTPKGSPPMDYIELHIKGNRKYARPVFWPHKFFAALAADRDDIFRERIVGLDGAAAQFWESIKDSEFMTKHPFLPRAHWNKIIPLGMHGDGGAFNAQDSLYVLSWNSLLGSGSTLQSKLLFSIVLTFASDR